METATTSNQKNTPETSDGEQIGSAASSKVGFHGATPAIQRAGAAQKAITDSTGATPSATPALSAAAAGACAGTSSPSAANVDSAIATAVAPLNVNHATILVLLNEIRAALVAKGIIKGAA